MTWLLTSKTGSSRGESWAIGTRPIILGRSLSCDITIGDPTVSRKHCEVKLEGDGIVFRDLGSRNVSLVNGKAVDSCRLLVGDELSLGSDSFIVTRTLSATAASVLEENDRPESTVSLGEALLLRDHPDDTNHSPYPSTVQDVLRLYRFGRKLSKAHDEKAFAALCLQELEEFFPARVSLAVCCTGATGNHWYPEEFAPTEELSDQVTACITSGEASMSCQRSKRLFFKELIISGVAPLLSSSRCYGVFLIQSMAREYVPESIALAQLDALAQTASPYLGCLDRRDIADTYRDQAERTAPPEKTEPPQLMESPQPKRLSSAGLGTLIRRPLVQTSGADKAVLATLEQAERTLISAVLTQCEGNVEVAASILGLSPVSLKGIAAQIANSSGRHP